jgi:valyl-tRNA synthetase
MHGLVRDAERQKMSKMKGNVIDPLEITAQYGTDAVRVSLLMGVAAGTDIVYTDEKLTSARAFANKIWNASRLLFMNMERSGVEPAVTEHGTLDTLEDQWMFNQLNTATELVTRAFENHRYHEAAETLWHFFWHDFCDWYLESKKLRLAENTGLTNDWRNLLAFFSTSLRLLHPMMPFITEELWHRLGETTSISLQPYPRGGGRDLEAEDRMGFVQDLVTNANRLRAEFKLGNKPLNASVYANGTRIDNIDLIEKLANIKLEVLSERPAKLDGAARSTPDFDLLIASPIADSAAQRPKLEKEIMQLEKLIADKDRQLSNEKFLASAPANIVDGLRAKRAEYQGQLDKSRIALNGRQ